MGANAGRRTERQRGLEETGAVVLLRRTRIDQIEPKMEINPEVRRILDLRMHEQ